VQQAAKPILSGGTLTGRFISENLVVNASETILAHELRDLFASWREAEGVSEDDLRWSTVSRILAGFGCVSRNLVWRGVGARKG
jgi:hypothetical protein